MSEHNYDSYCGIYCGACDIHTAYKTGRKTRLSTFWSEPLLKTFLRSQRVDYKDSRTLQLQCDGCKSDNVFINCKICRIRACAIDKKVEHCIDCSEYPCAMIVGRKKIEGLLPHLKCTHSNMETIRKNNVAQWLLEQEKQWQCPDCRTSFAWYSTKCGACGKDLRGKAYKFTFVQSALLKLGIRLASLKKN